ncbi:uncharacterized protein LOC135385315 isoform X2 [Ornithodoros turicata]|uniref:uncharacterized protein LOC135385315 isoform X2 n=1 Tax=Ornithodoros turicata TaxID=34597 RepID=UPI003139FE50
MPPRRILRRRVRRSYRRNESMSKELDTKTLCQLQSTASLTPSVATAVNNNLGSPTEGPPEEEIGEEYIMDPELYAAIPEPPDGGWGWMIVLSSVLCNMVVDGITYTFGIFFPEFVSYFQAPKGTVAWVGSLLSGCYLSAGPLVSALTNRFGCRTVCIGGSIISCIAFLLSTVVPDVGALMFTFGIMGGIGFGLIYLPAIVSVNQYFSKKRALATGIAVCGSGLGAFVFAPFCQYLLGVYNWKGALMILAGLSLNCAVFGALMRPLVAEDNPHTKPLLQRIWEEKTRLRQDSLCNSQFFLVQHADGTIEKRPKLVLNTEPGVHSTLYLDQWGRSPMDTPVITLSPIEESRPSQMGSREDQTDDSGKESECNASPEKQTEKLREVTAPDKESENVPGKQQDAQTERQQEVQQEETRKYEKPVTETTVMLPHEEGREETHIDVPDMHLPPNGHVPNGGPPTSAIQEFAKRKGIIPSRSATKLFLSNITMGSEMRRNSSSPRMSASSVIYSTNRQSRGSDVWKRVSQETVAGGPRTMQKVKKKDIARPMYRKDIFYSGSVVNLPEYRLSQGDVRSYVASVLTLPADTGPTGAETADGKPGLSLCPPCLRLPASMSDTFGEMLDMGLLKNPAFVLICVSNIIGMMGFCIPFMYLADSATLKGIDKESSAFLLSIIGITNMFGRLLFGWLSDFPQVNCLLLNNLSLCLSGVAVVALPFCHSYAAIVTTCIIFGLIVAAYILLTSIILVELFGLDNLTNSFGLLSLCRGAACMVGPPLAGSIFDRTGSYDVPFFFSGSLMIVSGIMSFFITRVRNPVQRVDVVHDMNSPLEEIPEEDDILEEEEDAANGETVV